MKKNIGYKMISVGLSALLLAGSMTGCSARTEETRTSAAMQDTQAYATYGYTEAATEAATAASSYYGGSGGTGGSGEMDGVVYEYEACEEITADTSFGDTYRYAYGADYQGSEEYAHEEENGFKSVSKNPLSTFSADVDTASYTNVRRMLNDYGYVYDPDSVRIEEMINYFDYDYALPGKNEAFGVTTQYTDCPWNPDANLLLVGVKTPDISFEDRPDNNLVFLIDVSGSMYSDDKLPLIQKAFGMLAENLTARDRVSIVTYAGYETVVLEGEPGNNTAKITAAINDLKVGGSTAGEAGIKKAYSIAKKNFIDGGNNRIILATDGDLNVGVSTVEGLEKLVSDERDSGIFLSVLGVGSGNIKDNKMETLADKGNGNYSYIDSIYEAKKVLVDEMGGTLVTVAKDVKFQVEFNPAQVQSYRLVGYENRLLRDEDFADDTVDAGEIGAGHTVTVLYEIIPAGSGSELKYQPSGSSEDKASVTPYADELLTVSVRYKEPNGDVSTLRSYPVIADDYTEDMPAEAVWASAVAEFGMLLKESPYSGEACREDVLRLAEDAMREYSDDYRKEFYQLAERYLN